MSEEKPYPNSYFIMIDELGRYIVHPDSTMLFAHTIFEGADPRRQPDIIALGHEMTGGKEGHMSVKINGAPCLVCYQPVYGTKWSLAVVCPDSDVLAGYHRLSIIVIPLLIVGLLIILLLTYRAVTQTISPLNKLLHKTQSIAEGDMEVEIQQSKREDAIGELQNSFATMLQSLKTHTDNIRSASEQTRQRNEELANATLLAQEAERQKAAFIQNVSHQIRTPLNIIMGFAQVLSDQNGVLPEEEKKGIADMMDHNSKLLSRMVLMLFDSSDYGLTEELNSHKHDQVPCNDVARETISYINLFYPDAKINLQSEVDEDFCIETSRLYLMRSLRELLYNAAKYSDGQHISFIIKRLDNSVQFIVEDKGMGIPEDKQDQIFQFFMKVDDLSEGLGLGLPLAKRHAKHLDGDLTLDANYKEGCRFILELPLLPPSP
jgi:signal transduction histidine kinase